MLHGNIPFENDEEILTGELEWFTCLNISQSAKSLVDSCLKRECMDRIAIVDILFHNWMNDYTEKCGAKRIAPVAVYQPALRPMLM